MAARNVCWIGRSIHHLCRRKGKLWQGHKSTVQVLVTSSFLPHVAARGCSMHTLTEPLHGEVTISYQKGLPVITVPLPSRKEKCRFTLRPVSNTVGHFIQNVQSEDRGIDRIVVETTDKIRISSTTSIESLMQEDFHLVINDITFYVSPPDIELQCALLSGRMTSEEVEKLSDIKSKVARLYEILQVDEFQIQQERILLGKMEMLKEKLEPMEKKKMEMIEASHKRTFLLSWVGLGLMGVQFGILARLTWWEYSWDIMEPVTYFITYGTTILMYAYFVMTRQEYYLPAVRDRQFLLTFHKRAQKEGLDVSEYNRLKDAIAQVEEDLRRLRDPLQLHLPIRELTHKHKCGKEFPQV